MYKRKYDKEVQPIKRKVPDRFCVLVLDDDIAVNLRKALETNLSHLIRTIPENNLSEGQVYFDGEYLHCCMTDMATIAKCLQVVDKDGADLYESGDLSFMVLYDYTSDDLKHEKEFFFKEDDRTAEAAKNDETVSEVTNLAEKFSRLAINEANESNNDSDSDCSTLKEEPLTLPQIRLSKTFNPQPLRRYIKEEARTVWSQRNTLGLTNPKYPKLKFTNNSPKTRPFVFGLENPSSNAQDACLSEAHSLQALDSSRCYALGAIPISEPSKLASTYKVPTLTCDASDPFTSKGLSSESLNFKFTNNSSTTRPFVFGLENPFSNAQDACSSEARSLKALESSPRYSLGAIPKSKPSKLASTDREPTLTWDASAPSTSKGLRSGSLNSKFTNNSQTTKPDRFAYGPAKLSSNAQGAGSLKSTSSERRLLEALESSPLDVLGACSLEAQAAWRSAEEGMAELSARMNPLTEELDASSLGAQGDSSLGALGASCARKRGPWSLGGQDAHPSKILPPCASTLNPWAKEFDIPDYGKWKQNVCDSDSRRSAKANKKEDIEMDLAIEMSKLDFNTMEYNRILGEINASTTAEERNIWLPALQLFAEGMAEAKANIAVQKSLLNSLSKVTKRGS